MAARVARVPLDHAVDGERAGESDRSRGSAAARRRSRSSRSTNVGVVDVVARHQLGDLRADAGELAEHRRADAELGGASCRLGLAAPVDAEQRRALAGDPHDELVAVDGDDVVAIGDATGERTDRQRSPFVHAGTRRTDGFDLLVHPKDLTHGGYLETCEARAGSPRCDRVEHRRPAHRTHGPATHSARIVSRRWRFVAEWWRSSATSPLGSSYSSPCDRARVTAELIMGTAQRARSTIAFASSTTATTRDSTTEQIRERAPGWTVWDGCPGGETVDDVVARVDSFLADVRAAMPRLGGAVRARSPAAHPRCAARSVSRACSASGSASTRRQSARSTTSATDRRSRCGTRPVTVDGHRSATPRSRPQPPRQP